MTTPRLEALEIECEKLRDAMLRTENALETTPIDEIDRVFLLSDMREALATTPISAKLVQLREAERAVIEASERCTGYVIAEWNNGHVEHKRLATPETEKLGDALRRRREILEEMK